MTAYLLQHSVSWEDEFCGFLGVVIFTIKRLREAFLQVTRASVTVGCPSFIIRSVFMEQASKLNIAAPWAQ